MKNRTFLYIILILVKLLCVYGYISPGFPCEKIPNFCDRVYCVPPDECSNGILINGGGNCGCCKICITFAGKDEPCTGDYKEPIVIPEGFLGLSYHFADTCQPGYHCDDTLKTCAIPGTSYCLYDQVDYVNNDWEVRPDCDFYGDFTPLRQKGRDTPRTFCEDKSGTTLFGRVPSYAVNVTCECSRLVDELVDDDNELYANIRCDEMGDFTPLQCWKDVCFCVDPYSRFMTTSAIPIAGIKALPCFNETLYNTTFYTACQNETYKMGGIIDELYIKGVDGILIQLPICDYDGTYAPVQYDGNRQLCVDRGGNQIGSFVNENAMDPTMDCKCARDGTYPDGLPNSYRFDDCGPYGDYNDKYQVGTQYYCLDPDGQQDSNLADTSDPNAVDCSKLITH